MCKVLARAVGCISFLLLHKTVRIQGSLCLVTEWAMVQTQPAHSHMVQARTDTCDLFLHGKHFLCDTSFCFRMPVASTGLCDQLWGTADQHVKEQRWVFSQQNWPAFHEHAAGACSVWGGLPQIASLSREERMTSTYFRFSSFSYCHHLLTSCSCHFPLAIRQLDSLQSDFWLSPFKLCFNKWIKYFQGPPQTNLSLF